MSVHNGDSTIGSSTPPRGTASPNVNDSPTSTLSQSTSRINNIRLDASTPYRSVFSSGTAAYGRQTVVRADPALLTCFDPADKELYDLWAPRR
ncbi:hypothetical protein FA13DRAFT_1788313 [Coprinellus micaceus]|uniref:Uncharacterized protein n=1 Tax=Coprinellus micaceus TaxID=71717 RepID=A0A4Y7TP10_COPMI|nr:hypothetical protein FA13DRAFT_1788313 [Coprinellus micaceus]